MFRKSLYKTIALLILASFLVTPTQALPGSTEPPLPEADILPQEWYLEVLANPVPPELSLQELESWYDQQVLARLEELLPKLESYRQQGRLQDFFPAANGVVLVGPEPLILAELEGSKLVSTIRPLDGDDLAAVSGDTPTAQRMAQEKGLAVMLDSSAQTEEAPHRAPISEQVEQPGLPDAASIATGHFNAYLFDRYLFGYTVSPLVTVYVSVTRLGELVASGSNTSDSGGYWSISLSSTFKMIPGDVVLVQASGQPDTSLVLPNATGTVHLANDVISGAAPANAPVSISAAGYLYDITASGTGAYSVDTTTNADLTSRSSTIYVTMTDPSTQNQVKFDVITPRYYLTLYSYICGYSGETRFNQELLITLRDEAGILIRSFGLIPEAEGYFCYYNTSSSYWYPSNLIEFTSAAGELIPVVVPQLTTNFNIAEDTISGLIQADATSLSVYVNDFESDLYGYFYPDPASGSYTVDTTDVLDLSPRDTGNITYYTPAGHRIYLSYTVPYVEVNRYSRTVSGYSLPNTSFDIDLYNSSGSLKASSYDYSDSTGYFYASFAGSILSIDVGDNVVVTPYGASAITVPVHGFTILPDVAANTVSGVALPNSMVEVRVLKSMLNTYYSGVYYAYYDMADSSGAYMASVGDLIPGDQVTVMNSNADGNVVRDSIGYLPAKVFVDAWANTISVYTLKSVDIDVVLKSSDGTVKAALSGTSSISGTFSISSAGDIVTGDVIEVNSAGILTTYVVIPMEITELERDLNRFSAHSLPAVTIGFNIRGNNHTSMLTDGSGNAVWLIDPNINMKGGDRVTISYLQGNNRQIVYGYVPSLRVQAAYNYVSGYGAPSSTLVIYLKDSLGTVKQSIQTTTSTSGYYNASFSALFVPGDILELHNAGQVITYTIQSLSVTADVASNVVTALGPPGAIASLTMSKDMGDYYSTAVQFDDTGSLILDLTGTYDVLNLSFASLTLTNLEGDHTSVLYILPGVSLSRDTDRVYGYAVPDSTVNLALKHDTTVKATAALGTDSIGYYATQRMCNGTVPADVVNGDAVFASPPSVSSAVPANTSVTLSTTTEKLTITTLPDTYLVFYYSHWYGSFYDTYQFGAYSDSSGVAEFNLLGIFDEGVSTGDFVDVYLYEPDGDEITFSGSTLSAANLGVSLLSYPAQARPNAPVYLEWEVTGWEQRYSNVRWDTVSHACDHNYSYSGTVLTGIDQLNTGSFMAPAAGTIYFSIQAYVAGHQLWTPEIAIPVSDIAPVIVDPVNGTTNDPTPTILGYGPAGELMNIYDGVVLLGSALVNPEGRFSFTVPISLSSTEHLIKAVTGSMIASNTIHLTINPALIVDPMHTFFTAREYRFRIKDENGYVNLGGRIWIRPNETVAIELPIQCTNVLDASLTVGSVDYALIDGGGGVWLGSFLLPSDNYAVIANINCNGSVSHTLLTYGLIDPDGYAFDSTSYQRLPGVMVTCLKLDTTTSQYEPWDAATWDQVNPQLTDGDGYYSFIVPPGTYKVIASYPGYTDYLSPELVVVDAPVHHNLPMIIIEWVQMFMPILLK